MIERANEGETGTSQDTIINGEFYRMGRVLAASLDLDTRLNRVLEQAMEILQAERGSIMLLDEERNELVVRASRGLKDSHEFRVDMGEGIAGWVAEHGEPLVLQDVVSDNRFSGTNPSIKSALAVPLKVDTKVIGVLNVSTTTKHRRFDFLDLEHLSSFADMAAVAIENARLYMVL